MIENLVFINNSIYLNVIPHPSPVMALLLNNNILSLKFSEIFTKLASNVLQTKRKMPVL